MKFYLFSVAFWFVTGIVNLINHNSEGWIALGAAAGWASAAMEKAGWA